MRSWTLGIIIHKIGPEWPTYGKRIVQEVSALGSCGGQTCRGGKKCKFPSFYYLLTSKCQVKAAAEKALKDMKSQDPDIDTSAMKLDVPNIKPPSNSKLPHPLPAIAPPVVAGFPALHPPGYAPGPARRGHNPIGRYPPQVAAPPQFPQI